MTIKVGIPRALMYHDFGELWCSFFRNLNTPVVVSGETNKHLLDRGTSLAIDESCLPLKLYLGHVDSLLSECSHIFVPRVARYHRDFYLCAKFSGLPDIVNNTFRLSPSRIIAPNIETNSRAGYFQAIVNTGRAVGHSGLSAYSGFHRALSAWRSSIFQPPVPAGPKVAVIGHSYILQDAFLGQEILNILKSRDVTPITPEQIPVKTLYAEARKLTEDIYWQFSAKLAGAASYFSRQPDIAGVILVSSFGCGLDSLTNEYLEHHVFQPSGKPHLVINLDEHTGQAGLVTRVEAFWDLVEWRLRA
jgi:predicted nucleotide-binding protein (sugar kinase/HSP70/actin superfamily)